MAVSIIANSASDQSFEAMIYEAWEQVFSAYQRSIRGVA
ncbi:MAG: hypothetical protein ACJAYU_001114 [Bradymonadia bacterium]|jgi:hypothetical protein